MKSTILFLILIIVFSCNNEPKYSEKEKEVLEIGKNVIKETYGEDVLLSKEPYTIDKKDSMWVVKGSLPDGWVGGVPYVFIDTTTLEVVDIYHTK